MVDPVLIPVLGVSIPLAGIVFGIGSSMFKRWARLKERQMELAASHSAEQAAQYAAKIERLEARVGVLERIATDRGGDLALEIEKLRSLPLN